MVVVQLYLTFTVLFFAFGPWPWPVSSPFKLYSFLFINQIALYLGYYFGVENYKEPTIPKVFDHKKLIKTSLIFSLVLALPTLVLFTGNYSLNLNVFIQKIIMGLIDAKAAYYERATESSSITQILILLITLPSYIVWLFIPLSIFNWRNTSIYIKIFSILLIIFNIVLWVSIGTNKGVFDVFIIVILSSVMASNYYPRKEKVFSFKIVARNVLLLALFVLLLAKFTSNIEARMGGMKKTELTTGIRMDENSVFIKYTPKLMHSLVLSLNSYVTQGYYGLSLGLELPMETTYGFGNSPFIFSLVNKFVDIKDQSLVNRIEENYRWGSQQNWHSFYTWWASDITFYLLPFLVFLFGSFFAKLWNDVLRFRNPFAIGLFTLMGILFAYMPANNQVFAFPATLFAFWGLYYFYSKTRSQKDERQ